MTEAHAAVLEDVMSALGRDSPAEIIRTVLRTARRHLGMEVGFVGEIHGPEMVVRWLDGDHESFGMVPMDRRRLEETYCRVLVRTGLPLVVSDALEVDELMALRVTHTAKVRSYIGAPIRVRGETVAVVCYAGHEPRPDFAESHRAFMHVLADLVSEQLERHREVWGERCAALERVSAAVRDGGPAAHLQPIVNLRDGAVVGAEALARFSASPVSAGDWFADAWRVGYGADLELAAIERAVDRIGELPGLAFLSINISPDPDVLDRIATTLAARDLRRVVLELTEHTPVADYPLLRRRIRCLRQRGARIAVDDTGAGFAGLGQLLHLAPDFIKLDQMLIRGIEDDPMRTAMASSLVDYADRVGAELVAEGLETDAEIDAVRVLGVRLGQGYRLGRPGPAAPPARIAIA